MHAIQRVHHFAWRCKDAELTRAFYEDILGLPLEHFIRRDTVPSTGEYCPYVHIFFRMQDGSFIAFFDLGDNEPSAPSPNTPAWVNHIALEVDTIDVLVALRKRLESSGVEVLGVTDHGFVQSIYFFDPNGLRVELTVRTSTPESMAKYAKEARGKLDIWTAEKRARTR